MIKEFLLFVPGDYAFGNYFLPKIKNPNIDFFEVSHMRRGVQRKGNNHLVAFLELVCKRPPAEYPILLDGEAGALILVNPSEREFFTQMFKNQKEVALFSLHYHARMSVLAWEIMVEIADDPRVMVKDDSVELARGVDIAAELKSLLRFKPGVEKI
jgi:hypothetical protein